MFPLTCNAAAGGLSSEDPRLLTVELDRVTGIDFGCDLTLSWPYVMAMTPNGAAERSGEIEKGDQLVAIAGASVLGLPIGKVSASCDSTSHPKPRPTSNSPASLVHRSCL